MSDTDMIQAGRLLVEGWEERHQRILDLKRRILQTFPGDFTDEEAEVKASGILHDRLWDDVQSMTPLVLAAVLHGARPVSYRVVYQGPGGVFVAGKRLYSTPSAALTALRRSRRGKLIEQVYPRRDE